MGSVCGHRQQPSDRQHMGTAFTPAKTSPASWDAFSDVEAFVDAVLVELAAMAADGTRRTRSGPKPRLTGAAQGHPGDLVRGVLRPAVARHWPALRHSIRHPVHAVRPRLGLWGRLLDRLIQVLGGGCCAYCAP